MYYITLHYQPLTLRTRNIFLHKTVLQKKFLINFIDINNKINKKLYNL